MEMKPTATRPNLERKGPLVIINPRITRYSKKKSVGWEACLSFKKIYGKVPRYDQVTVEYMNEHGEKVTEHASGFWARIFQHEIDHLNGMVFVDRMEDTKTLMTLSEFKKRILKK